MRRFSDFVYDKARIEAFSDGVFAIIITLLVLEIRVPALKTGGTLQDGFNALFSLRGEIVSFIISFFHHRCRVVAASQLVAHGYQMRFGHGVH